MKSQVVTPLLGALVLLGAVSCSPLSVAPSKQVAAKKQTVKRKNAIKTLKGVASWYSVRTNGGRRTASGRLLNDEARTAAHKTLPFGSEVRVTCLFNGKSEVLRITDRGPYTKGRVIDVTKGTAKRLGFHKRGITKVKVDVLELGTWKYRHPGD